MASGLADHSSSGLDSNTTIYRTLTKNGWVDRVANRAKPAAFVMRPNDVGSGLSTEYGIAPAACGAHLSNVVGLGELVVGRVRSIPPLDVVPDSDPQFPNHAFITGVPYVNPDTGSEEEFRLKEDLATALSLQSTLVLRENTPRPPSSDQSCGAP